jgi:hypothetical protein
MGITGEQLEKGMQKMNEIVERMKT